MIFALVALTARLEATKRVLSEEKADRLAVHQSLAEEKAVRLVTD
jgi:hypothetical protein